MSNIVIITAKKTNSSIKNKNLTLIAGKPSIVWGIEASLKARSIDQVFVFSDGANIRKIGEDFGCTGIKEPKELTTPEANHGDAIKYAVEYVKNNYLKDLKNVTILLANTVAINSELIDLSHEVLKKNNDIDSVMSVWQAQDDHPYRALQINNNGLLESFLNIKAGTSRQSYPSVYFYDQGIWTFRWQNVQKKDGPNPWWWMGKKSFPIIRNWVTGRDTHTQLDLDFCEYWINNNHKDEILNKKDIDKII